MGEAKQRRAAGLGFKSESREIQKVEKAKEKKLAAEIAFEKSLKRDDVEGEPFEWEWEGMNDDGTTDYFRRNEKEEEEIWNKELERWELEDSENLGLLTR